MKMKEVTRSDSVSQSSAEAPVTELKPHEVDQVSGGAGNRKPTLTPNLNAATPNFQKTNQYL
jgi:hypothetical protein